MSQEKPLSDVCIAVMKRMAAQGHMPGYQIRPSVRGKLEREGLIECPQRGAWCLTDAGRAALATAGGAA